MTARKNISKGNNEYRYRAAASQQKEQQIMTTTAAEKRNYIDKHGQVYFYNHNGSRVYYPKDTVFTTPPIPDSDAQLMVTAAAAPKSPAEERRRLREQRKALRAAAKPISFGSGRTATELSREVDAERRAASNTTPANEIVQDGKVRTLAQRANGETYIESERRLTAEEERASDTTAGEQFKHDVCPECGTPSEPAEKVPDQSLRGCPNCEHVWTEDLIRAPLAASNTTADADTTEPSHKPTCARFVRAPTLDCDCGLAASNRSDSAAATARPWDCIGAMITRANELAPVALTGPYIPQDSWPDRGRAEAEANAALIVQAVNSFDSREQALRELITAAAAVDNKLHAGFTVAQISAEQSRLYNAINTAKAALALAEGKGAR